MGQNSSGFEKKQMNFLKTSNITRAWRPQGPAGLWSPGRSTVTAVVSRGYPGGRQHAGPRHEAGLGRKSLTLTPMQAPTHHITAFS